MWVCPTCHEPHEDQFKECWKCFGIETRVAEGPPKIAQPRPEPKLRSFGSILVRAFFGFCAGTLLGLSVTHRNDVPLEQAAQIGLVCGAVVGFVVGVFIWVVYPFEPVPRRMEDMPSDAELPSPQA